MHCRIRGLQVLRDGVDPELELVELHFHQVSSAKAESDESG